MSLRPTRSRAFDARDAGRRFHGVRLAGLQRGQQVALRGQFVSNRIDTSLFSPAAMAVARQLPITTDPCGDVRFAAPVHYDQSQIVAKIDYQGSGGHSVFGRYMLTFDEQLPVWPGSGSVLTTRAEDAAQRHRAHSLTLGDTRVFGSNVVNAARWRGTAPARTITSSRSSVPRRSASEVFNNYVPGVYRTGGQRRIRHRIGRVGLFQGDTDAYQISDDVTWCEAAISSRGRQRGYGRTTRSTVSVAAVSGPSTDRSPGSAWRTSSRDGWPVSSTRGPAFST